ncbi:MAG: NAD(P)H-dependent oxidoreductase [Betaproteobacteria bacterium]|nr:NAD(P)H-dependent oxidoreductase [Betaproteobacteria bacterium]
MSVLKVVAISGSLRAKSYNHAALRAAAELAPDDLEIRIVDYAAVPLYNQDDQAKGFPGSVEALRAEIAGADGLLIASPEYNFSVSGVLKNAIDWLSRTNPQPFKGKPTAILSATMGPIGGARSQYDLRKIIGGIEANVLTKPEVFIGACHTKFNEQGQLTDEATRKIIGEQMLAFRNWIRQLGPRS